MLTYLATTLPEPIEWMWRNIFQWMWWPETGFGYAFFSSVGGTPLFALGGLTAIYRVYKKHVECHEDGCSRRGKYMIEGGVRCCDEHHPALDTRPFEERGFVHNLHIKHYKHLHLLLKS